MLRRYKILLLVLFGFVPLHVDAYFPLNIFRSYDLNTYHQYWWNDTRVNTSLTGEFSVTIVGRDALPVDDDRSRKNNEVNILKIWNNDQNVLGMLKGLVPTTNLGSFSQLVNIDDDDGVRGHIDIRGDLDVRANIPFSARVHLPYDFVIGAYLSLISLDLDIMCMADLTQSQNNDDFLVKSILTNNLVSNVKSLTGIELCGWNRTGISDLAVIGEWQRDFPQAKPLLKNVRPRLRAGLSLPTGRVANEDKIMSIPLGNDGALGIIFGGGLDLTIGYKLKVGLDAEFLNLFNDIRERRIKTHSTQTDLLFPVKACALKEYGITERFNLYLEFFDLIKGLNFRTTYQYFKHDVDELKIMGNQYSSIIANTAASLDEWTMHNIILNLNYDFQTHANSPWYKPYLSLFYKKGVNGKSCILADTVGATFGFSF